MMHTGSTGSSTSNRSLKTNNGTQDTALRTALTAYFQAKDSPAPPPGYHHWNCSSAIVAASAQQPRLLVGDPIALAVHPPTHQPHSFLILTYILTNPQPKKTGKHQDP